MGTRVVKSLTEIEMAVYAGSVRDVGPKRQWDHPPATLGAYLLKTSLD
jgi:hypothetical protein